MRLEGKSEEFQVLPRVHSEKQTEIWVKECTTIMQLLGKLVRVCVCVCLYTHNHKRILTQTQYMYIHIHSYYQGKVIISPSLELLKRK